MGERKVLNKYFPPDFDPAWVPKGKRSKVMNIRMMLPFSVQCKTCGEFMYAGKKFNSRCEIVEGDTYLGLRKYRFYVKCSVCCAEIAFKTDPQKADYELEAGATRNFESWKLNRKQEEEAAKAREDEDKDSIKALENRALDSKIEMDILDALDEIKAINQRHRKVDPLHSLLLRDKERAAAAAAAAGGGPAAAAAEGALTEEERRALEGLRAARAAQLNRRLSESGDEGEGEGAGAPGGGGGGGPAGAAGAAGGGDVGKDKVRSLKAEMSTVFRSLEEQQGPGAGGEVVVVVKAKKKKKPSEDDKARKREVKKSSKKKKKRKEEKGEKGGGGGKKMKASEGEIQYAQPSATAPAALTSLVGYDGSSAEESVSDS